MESKLFDFLDIAEDFVEPEEPEVNDLWLSDADNDSCTSSKISCNNKCQDYK